MFRRKVERVQHGVEQRPLVVAIVPFATPATGGAQADLLIVEHLRRLGWKVELVPFLHGPEYASPWFPWRNFIFGLRMMWRYRRLAPGAIFFQDQALAGMLGVFNGFAQRWLRARIVIMTYHLQFNLWRNPVRRAVRRVIEGRVLRHADVVLASSRSTERELIALGVPIACLRIVRLGITRRNQTEIDIPPTGTDDVVRLLSVGTVEPRKGLEYLLRALSQLSECAWQLDLVGGLDLGHHASLKELARSLHIADRVRFHGRVADPVLEAFMASAQVYVSPSLGEGFGLAVLEAMERGLPVVASEAGALTELIENERTGLLVPPQDPDALAAALRRTMVDPELRTRLGQSAREAVRGRYSWEETGRQVEAVLMGLCDNHRL